MNLANINLVHMVQYMNTRIVITLYRASTMRPMKSSHRTSITPAPFSLIGYKSATWLAKVCATDLSMRSYVEMRVSCKDGFTEAISSVVSGSEQLVLVVVVIVFR